MKESKVKKIIKKYNRVLVGFAHYDKGMKQPGCDCCFCSPRKKDR